MKEYLTLTVSNARLATKAEEFVINLRQKTKHPNIHNQRREAYADRFSEEQQKVGVLCLADILNILSENGWELITDMPNDDMLVFNREKKPTIL